MDILEIVQKIDLEMLKEQTEFIDDKITEMESDYNEAVTDEVAERINYDIDLAKGLLELLDNLIIALEEV